MNASVGDTFFTGTSHATEQAPTSAVTHRHNQHLKRLFKLRIYFFDSMQVNTRLASNKKALNECVYFKVRFTDVS